MKKTLNRLLSQLCEEMLKTIDDEVSFMASVFHTSSYFELSGPGKVSLTCETNHLGVAKKVFSFLKRFSGDCEIKVEKQLNQEIKKLKVIASVVPEMENFFTSISMDMFEVSDLGFLDTEEALSNYLKGVFLSCGYMENYQERYFVEFYFRNEHYSNIFYRLYRKYIPDLKKRMKKNRYAVFSQTKQGVETFLNLSNATGSYFKLLDTLIIKEIKGGINRKTNCEMANLDRISDAYLKFVASYQDFINRGGDLEKLPEKLKTVVRIRDANPEYSLGQIGELTGMNKSNVNYWLKKFYQIVEEM